MILPIDKIYAVRLRSLRIQKDIKQSTLAQMLDLNSQQDYSKLEHGQKHFTVKLIENICKAFNIKLTDFTNHLLEKENHHQNSAEQSELKEIETLKNIVSLKSEIAEYHKMANLMSIKMVLEKDIEIIQLKIQSITSSKRLYYRNNDYVLIEYF